MKSKAVMELFGVVFIILAGICMAVFCIMCLLSRKYLYDLIVAVIFGLITKYMYKKKVKSGFWRNFCLLMCAISSLKYSWRCIFCSGYGFMFGIGVVLSIIAFLFFVLGADTKKENIDDD